MVILMDFECFSDLSIGFYGFLKIHSANGIPKTVPENCESLLKTGSVRIFDSKNIVS